MIGKHVVIDTLDNFKTKLDLIPSSAIVLIKDVGQIYAHGTYFGAQKTYSLLTKTADGLAPKGGTSASSLISNVDTEWVLTVTKGDNPSWRKLPANAFNNSTYTLPSATTKNLGGLKVGNVSTSAFADLNGNYYKLNIDKDGLAYVHVPWEKYNLPTATSETLGGVKVGNTLTSITNYTAVPINNGKIYFPKFNIESPKYENAKYKISVGDNSYDVHDLFINGLGTELESGTDLDTIKTPSIYKSNGSTKSATLINAPWSKSGFRLLTLRGYYANDNYGSQIALASTGVFWRMLGANNSKTSSWYSWIPFEYGLSVGNSSIPIYINSSGQLKECTSILATNLAGDEDEIGGIFYQSGENTTSILKGSNENGYVLKYNTSTKTPYWGSDSNTWIAWKGATASAAGTAGYMPAPKSTQRNQFLRGDGQWVSLNNYSLPIASSSTLGGVKTGEVITDVTGYTAISIKDGVLYYKDSNTTYTFYNLAFKNSSGTTVDTYKPTTSPSKTIKAGSNISISAANNVITIEATDTTYGVVSSSANGLAPKTITSNTTTITERDDEWVLTTTKGATPTWRLLPTNAFKNSDTKVNVVTRGITKAYLLGTTTSPTSTAQAVTSVAETGVYFDTTAATLVATTFKGNLTGTASKVTCTASDSDADRPIVLTNTSNDLYYSTKATINYKTGHIKAGELTSIGQITLYSSSGDSPHLYFLRGTTLDGTYDWDLYVTSGYMKFRYNKTGTWTEVLSLYPGSSKLDGLIILHEGNYDSYLGYIGKTAVLKSGADLALTGITDLTMSGNLTITPKNTDNFINFSYNSGTTYSWRLGYLGTGSGDANYFVVQSAKAAGTSWNNVIRLGNETLDAAFGGNVHPLVNDTKTLGTSDLRWNNVYSTYGNFSGAIKFNTINIPTTSGGTTFGPGSKGQVLKSNGTTVYWGSDNNSSITISNSGTGNAVTELSASGHTITATKGSFASTGTVEFTPANSELTPLDVLNITGEWSIRKGSWNYSKNGYIVAGSFGNIDLAGTSVLTFGNSSAYTQLYITAPSQSGHSGKTNEIFFYNNHGNDYNPGWTRVITSSNYTDYINTENFSGLDKVGTITEVAAGVGLSGGGTSGKVTITNAGVRSVTIGTSTNADKVAVNTNGTTKYLTIPYATYTTSIRVTETEPTTGTYYYPIWTSDKKSGTSYSPRANEGFRYYTLEGTTSAKGASLLFLGNNKAEGTAGNKEGRLGIYGPKSYYAYLYGPDKATGTFYFPNTGGTLVTHEERGIAVGASAIPVYIDKTGRATACTIAEESENENRSLMVTDGNNEMRYISTITGNYTTGSLASVVSNTTAVSHTCKNSNGAVSLYAAADRGLYDSTNSAWIVLLTQDAQHVYISKWKNKGSNTAPVYFNSSGEPVAGSTYAGGTKVTLNGTAKGASTASFYAPTGAGTSGLILTSNGSGAPTWKNQSNLNAGTVADLGVIYNKLFYNKKSVTMTTVNTVWYIKIVLSGYAQPCQFMIGGSYNNQIDRAIIETSGMNRGYIYRNCNLNEGNITGIWHQTNYDSTEEKWIFWIRLKGIDNSSSHDFPSSSATYTVYMGEKDTDFAVTATTTEPSEAEWDYVDSGITIKGNSDTVDGYHLLVTNSAGTDSSTIYFVT